MSPLRRRRLLGVLVLLAGTGLAVALLLRALDQNMSFYFTPTQVLSGEAPAQRVFRVGGLVVAGSVQRARESLQVGFVLSDGQAQVPVVYHGILPDLFREGQGVIARGQWQDGQFVAEEVLAKHDETYMPPEVAESLKKPLP